jgi:2-polyprenyl-6-methoxyphenol hydroxylase-like FAD-dependent oxidoreductase
LRHYERLPYYLEGFLVLGDAVYTLNPVYAQGMTLAVMGSAALERALKAHRRAGLVADVTGLAQRFQQALVKIVTPAWKVATRGDRQWPTTEVAEPVEATTETKASKIIDRTPVKLTRGLRPFEGSPDNPARTEHTLTEHSHALAH